METTLQTVPKFISNVTPGANCVLLLLFTSQAPTPEELSAANEAARRALAENGAQVVAVNETAAVLAYSPLEEGESAKLSLETKLIKVSPDAVEQFEAPSFDIEEDIL